MGGLSMDTANFTPLDMQNWPRSQMFYYFTQMAPTGYSMTAQVNITIIRNTLKANNIKFFPAYIWLVTKTLNKQTEFKVAMKDDVLGYWDSLMPLHSTFHDDDKTFSFMWTEYCEDFHEFNERYLDNQRLYKDTHGILSQPHQMPPPNAYTVSCLPWIEFQHFAVHSYENKPYYFPSVEAGKFINQGNSVTMPLSITVHHATTDGWHIKCFLEDLQEAMDGIGEWI
jgi:chloramphenicol O-acetyltransferase type A